MDGEFQPRRVGPLVALLDTGAPGGRERGTRIGTRRPPFAAAAWPLHKSAARPRPPTRPLRIQGYTVSLQPGAAAKRWRGGAVPRSRAASRGRKRPTTTVTKEGARRRIGTLKLKARPPPHNDHLGRGCTHQLQGGPQGTRGGPRARSNRSIDRLINRSTNPRAHHKRSKEQTHTHSTPQKESAGSLLQPSTTTRRRRFFPPRGSGHACVRSLALQLSWPCSASLLEAPGPSQPRDRATKQPPRVQAPGPVPVVFYYAHVCLDLTPNANAVLPHVHATDAATDRQPTDAPFFFASA